MGKVGFTLFAMTEAITRREDRMPMRLKWYKVYVCVKIQANRAVMKDGRRGNRQLHNRRPRREYDG
jgi:hypothetical protein